MGSNHRTLIFGNGTLYDVFLQEIRPGDVIIGVDRAAYWLIRHGVIPDLAIGDFDSVTKQELAVVRSKAKQVRSFPKEKNWTDMELSLQYARGETYIFGGSGTRLDHTLATLSAVKAQIFVDHHNRIQTISKGRTILKPGGYRYVSILPITSSITISLSGFAYNLTKTKLRRGTTRGVSNELRGRQGTIDLHAGKAWVIESND